MKSFAALLCIFTVAHGSTVYLVPAVTNYHSQDAWGQYAYGYSGGPSAKQELRTIDGITQGSYSYVDANNVVQFVSYVSDPIHGFRVAATNIPQQAPHIVTPLEATVIAEPEPAKEETTTEVTKQEETTTIVELPKAPEDTAEVKAAKEAHLKAFEEVRVAAEHSRKRRSVVYTSPLAVVYSPILGNQYHVQDTLGQYSYGYNDGLSSKAESRSADGSTSGSYSYVDLAGQVQNVNYVADTLGFRVAASGLPEAPKAEKVQELEAAVAPTETPEVKAAREAHLAAYEETKAKLFA